MFEKLKKIYKLAKSLPKRDETIFDWTKVPAPDPDEVDRWLGATDRPERMIPLQIALQVHDQIERKLMKDVRLDALMMAEIRGGLRALASFAAVYQHTLGAEELDA